MAFVLASFFAYQAFASGRLGANQSAGHIVFEADENGTLRRVERATVVSSPTAPLWKPEPSLLLERGSTLSLSSDQRERIAEVDGAWADEKKSLEQSIETAFEQGTGGDKTRKESGAIPVAALTQGMQGYTELSTLYNQRRESHWLQALAVLTPSQQNLVEQIRKEAKR